MAMRRCSWPPTSCRGCARSEPAWVHLPRYNCGGRRLLVAAQTTPETVEPGTPAEPVAIEPAAAALLDAEARAIVQRLGAWAYAHAAAYGICVESIRASRWQSVEE